MKNTILTISFLIGGLQVSMAQTTASSATPAPRANFFTGGTATVERMVTAPELNCGVSKVTFPAKTRTIWHAHAGGQIIIVTLGTAYYQEKGKPKQILRQGEAVACPPNVMHWHGASPDGPMSHTVATPNLDKGGVTTGAAISDEDYNRPM